MSRVLLPILWPSFLAAGVGLGIIFTLFDPMELTVMGDHIRVSRTTVYSLGFFILWAITTAASAMSCFLLVNSGSRGAEGEENEVAGTKDGNQPSR
jgi:hypothetical protein